MGVYEISGHVGAFPLTPTILSPFASMEASTVQCSIDKVAIWFVTPKTRQSESKRWSPVKNALHPANIVNCGLAQRVVIPWIYAESLGLFDTWQSIPAGNR